MDRRSAAERAVTQVGGAGAEVMTIGELSRRCGVPVRALLVFPEAGTGRGERRVDLVKGDRGGLCGHGACAPSSRAGHVPARGPVRAVANPVGFKYSAMGLTCGWASDLSGV